MKPPYFFGLPVFLNEALPPDGYEIQDMGGFTLAIGRIGQEPGYVAPVPLEPPAVVEMGYEAIAALHEKQKAYAK